LRGSDKAAVVQKAYPRVRVVLGDLDSTSLIEEEARQADVVISKTMIQWILIGSNANRHLDAATYKHQPSIEAIARGLASRSTPGE